jgi:hypothetical protein
MMGMILLFFFGATLSSPLSSASAIACLRGRAKQAPYRFVARVAETAFSVFPAALDVCCPIRGVRRASCR